MRLIVIISKHLDGDCNNRHCDVSHTHKVLMVFMNILSRIVNTIIRTTIHKHCVTMASIQGFCGLVLSTVASVHHGFCPPWPCDFEWCIQVSFKWHNRDIIDNRDYMDTIIVMLENPQSLSPSRHAY